MPGVGPKDVVVEGITINTALLPISLPIPTLREVTAFTALRFHLPDGTTAGRELCPAPHGAHDHGRDRRQAAKRRDAHRVSEPPRRSRPALSSPGTSAAPKSRLRSKRSTVGQLSGGGKTVTFPGISRLGTGNTLSVVILPGSLGLERLVFSAPDKSTLSLLDFGVDPACVVNPHRVTDLLCDAAPALHPAVPIRAARAAPPLPPDPGDRHPRQHQRRPSRPIDRSRRPSDGRSSIQQARRPNPTDQGDRHARRPHRGRRLAHRIRATREDPATDASSSASADSRSARTGPPPADLNIPNSRSVVIEVVLAPGLAVRCRIPTAPDRRRSLW